MRVVNLRTLAGEGKRVGVVRVDRATVLGNPFVIGRDGDRAQVIELYRRWLYEQLKSGNAKVIAALLSLREGDLLGCWCTPEPCHADVVIRAARWLRQQQS